MRIHHVHASLRGRLFLLFVVALVLLPSSVPTPTRAAGTVNVRASTATPHFPQDITFHLEATASQSQITGADLLYHPTLSPIWQRVRVRVERGASVTMDYTLNMQARYLPPGIDIEYAWLFTLADGSTARSVNATFLYMDPSVQWKKVQKGRITLWWYNGDNAFAQDAVDTAARTADAVAKTYSAPPDRPIRILLYGSTRDLQAALQPNSPSWLASMTTPNLGVILAAIQPAKSFGESTISSEVRRVIPHEVTRLVLYDATRNPYSDTLPAWLDEGLATVNQETPDLRYRPLLYDAVTNGKLIPLRALNSPFPINSDQALLSYAESESVVRYIINSFRPGTLVNLVAAFKDGLSYDEAVQQALKESNIDELDKDWKASLNYGGDQGGLIG